MDSIERPSTRVPQIKLGESIPPDTAHVSHSNSQNARPQLRNLLLKDEHHQGCQFFVAHVEIQHRL